MNPGSKEYSTDIFFGTGHQEEHLFQSPDFARVKYRLDVDCSKLVDVHRKKKVEIHYLQVASADGPARISFSSAGKVRNVLTGNEFGLLLTVEHEQKVYTVWLPAAALQCCFDQFQRFASAEKSLLPWHWEVNAGVQLNLSLSGMPGEEVLVPFMLMEDAGGEYLEEITTLNTIERTLYRKSDWFFADKPADIWKYLINGSLYDPRGHKGMNKRFKCQQCALAWWSYFNFLKKETGKTLYDSLQDNIAYSVLLDLSPGGEWRHGFWKEDMEIHARFQLDGIHLLISQHEKTGEAVWLEAAERAMAYVAKHLMDQLDDGSVWFLHDTTEHQDHRTHFQSRLFGKSPGNSLCINTHVQALTVLHRLKQRLPHQTKYAGLLEKGLNALKRVLEHQPADALYKIFVFMWLNIRKKPRSKAAIVMHAVKTRSLIKTFWAVRRRFPRLAYPGGWIDRDLTISCFSENYQVTNLKDFLTLYQQMPLPWLVPYIKNNFQVLKKFLAQFGLNNALEASPYYVEYLDVLYLYDRYMEKVDDEEMKKAKETIYRQTGGCSLDYYAAELVRGK